MKTDTTSGVEKKHGNAKKSKGYFERLLEMQLRKTDSDRRREMFGFDPLIGKGNLSF